MLSRVENLEPTPREARIYPARLRDARLLARLRSTEAATQLGMTKVQYSRLEGALGVTSTTPEMLTKISKLFGFDTQYFSSFPDSNALSGGLHFRAQRSMTKFDEEIIEAWARFVSELVSATYVSVRPLSHEIPAFESTMRPAQAADETRRLLGLDVDEPVPHMIRVLERAGVPVARAPFDGAGAAKHDAVSLWTGERSDRPIVLLRDITSWERTRMSAAHELGHLVLHRWVVAESAEEEAFDFASAFLMPARGFRRGWPSRVTLTSLLPLKRKWGVSLAALIERGFRLGLLSAPARTGLYKQLSARRNADTGTTWRVEEPGSREREPEAPWLLGKMLETSLGDEPTPESVRAFSVAWPDSVLQPVLAGQRRPRGARPPTPPSNDGPASNVTPLFG